MPKPLSLLTAVLTALSALAVAGVTSDWEEYTDNELHVAFRHPGEVHSFVEGLNSQRSLSDSDCPLG